MPCPAGFQKLPPGSGRCYSICPVNSQSWLAAQVRNCFIYYYNWKILQFLKLKHLNTDLMDPMIYVRGHRRGNQNGQSREIGRIWFTKRRKTKQKHNTICVWHHYAQTNTNNINKTWKYTERQHHLQVQVTTIIYIYIYVFFFNNLA